MRETFEEFPKLTIFVTQSHDSVHVISVVYNKGRQILHIHSNIRPFFDLQIRATEVTIAELQQKSKHSLRNTPPQAFDSGLFQGDP